MDQQENAEIMAHEEEIMMEGQVVGDGTGYYEYVEVDEGAVDPDMKEPIYMEAVGDEQVEIDEAGGYVDANGTFIPTNEQYYEADEQVDEHGQLIRMPHSSKQSAYPVQYIQQHRRPPQQPSRLQYATTPGSSGGGMGYGGAGPSRVGGSGGMPPPHQSQRMPSYGYQPSPRRQLYQAPPVATPGAYSSVQQYGADHRMQPPQRGMMGGVPPGGRAPMDYRQMPPQRQYAGMDYNKSYFEQEEMKPMTIRPLGNISNTSMGGVASPLVSTLGFPRAALAAAAGRESYTGGSILTSFLGNSKTANKIRKASSKKKPCNCTKSMCLKLYCDCFANGEFCLDCNCRDCHNNLEHESERSKAIKSSLERNPGAFKPKIGVSAKVGRNVDMERLHQKGCQCKKSNCLKNYCECYEAKVPCTDRCKCQSCRNTEHDRHHKYKDKFSTTAGGLAQLAAAAANDARSNSPFSDDDDDACGGASDAPNPKTQPWFYLTEDVTEAITMCLVAQAQEMEDANVEDEALEQGILGEFGRCLEQIIDNAKYCQQTIIA